MRRVGLPEFARAALRRAWRGLVTWPRASGWATTALVGAGTLAAIGGIGLSTGLYKITEPATGGLTLRMIETLIAPAIGEEVVFRGLLIPDRAERTPFLPAPAFSEGVFVLWHVVEAETFLPVARTMFLRPDFLAIAAILGLVCAILRRATGSLWPAIALHWTMVTLWQTFLGGFTL